MFPPVRAVQLSSPPCPLFVALPVWRRGRVHGHPCPGPPCTTHTHARRFFLLFLNQALALEPKLNWELPKSYEYAQTEGRPNITDYVDAPTRALDQYLKEALDALPVP